MQATTMSDEMELNGLYNYNDCDDIIETIKNSNESIRSNSNSPEMIEALKQKYEEISNLRKEVDCLSRIISEGTLCFDEKVPLLVVEKWKLVLSEYRKLESINSKGEDFFPQFCNYSRQICQFLNTIEISNIRSLCDEDFPLNNHSIIHQIQKQTSGQSILKPVDTEVACTDGMCPRDSSFVDKTQDKKNIENTSESQTTINQTTEYDTQVEIRSNSCCLTVEFILSNWICHFIQVLQQKFAYATYTAWDMIIASMKEDVWHHTFSGDQDTPTTPKNEKVAKQYHERNYERFLSRNALDNLHRLVIQIDASSFSDKRKTYILIAKCLRSQMLHDLMYQIIRSQIVEKYYFKDAIMRHPERQEQYLCIAANMSAFPLPVTTTPVKGAHVYFGVENESVEIYVGMERRTNIISLS